MNGEPQEVSFAPYKTCSKCCARTWTSPAPSTAASSASAAPARCCVDGVPVLSCLVLALECEGRAIETVEGLARRARAASAAGGVRRPRRRAVRLLHAGHPHDRQGAARRRTRTRAASEIKEATAGQSLPLHRLSADLRVDRGAARAGCARRNDDGEEALRRRSASRAAASTAAPRSPGQLRFADDLVLPRMLHCKLLRSPHAARGDRVDRYVARAQAHPGVHLVLTGKDFPVPFGILPVTQDEYPLAPERVRYVGDPVAAVIARDEQTAFEALDLIDVEIPGAEDRSPIRRRRSRIPSRASTTTASRATSTATRPTSSATSKRRWRSPTTSSRTCSSTRATRTCRWSSTPRSPSVDGDGKLHALVLEHPGAALPAPRARARAADAARRTIRVIAMPERRRLRRQVRSGTTTRSWCPRRR